MTPTDGSWIKSISVPNSLAIPTVWAFLPGFVSIRTVLEFRIPNPPAFQMLLSLHFILNWSFKDLYIKELFIEKASYDFSINIIYLLVSARAKAALCSSTI